MEMTVLDLAKRVKRGAKLLDRLIPTWRTIMRRHANQFVFSEGEHCVLGTLEHYNGRMKELRRKSRHKVLSRSFATNSYDPNFGFDAPPAFEPDNRGVDSYEIERGEFRRRHAILSDLWRAEFEK